MANLTTALAAVLYLGCARPAAPEGPADAARAVTYAQLRADASPPAPDGGPFGGPHRRADGGAPSACDEIEAAWTDRRAAASGRCTRAADCACYTSSLVAPNGQEATDVATARALAALARKFSRRSCPIVCVDGTPDVCRADCVDGRCVTRHLPPR